MTHSEMNYYHHIVRPVNFFLKTIKYQTERNAAIHFPRWLQEPKFKN